MNRRRRQNQSGSTPFDYALRRGLSSRNEGRHWDFFSMPHDDTSPQPIAEVLARVFLTASQMDRFADAELAVGRVSNAERLAVLAAELREAAR
jgi:hypothetical protein